jgi:CRP-like cAMP-binding protein
MMNTSTIDLRAIPLFAPLSQRQLDSVRDLMQLIAFQRGQLILEEGVAYENRIFIVLEGEVSVCKRGRSPLDGSDFDFEIEVRGPSDVFNAASVLDDKPLPYKVVAKTAVTIAVLDLCKRCRNPLGPRIRNSVIADLKRYVADHFRKSFDTKMDSLRRDAEYAAYRNAVGNIIVATLSLLSFYTLALSLLPSFEAYLNVNFAITPFIITLFALIFFPVILRSGFPLSFFGMRLDNWRSAVSLSLTASLAFIGIGLALKWLAINTIPAVEAVPLIDFADIRVGSETVMLSPIYWAAVALYLVLTPVQEFVARCGVQAPLYAFLQGSETKRQVLSILVSNLVFSAAHVHISLEFALAAFIPGIFWGWIFARTRSLLAASLSHFLIGGAGIFLFGIEDFVARLA